MPAPKKAGSARASKASAAATTPPAPDPTPAADSTTTQRKKRTARPKKTFLLYAVDGHELSFITESSGATGQIATLNAVKIGTIAVDTPVVALSPGTLKRTVEVEGENVGIRYKIKPAAKKRKKPGPKPAAEAPAATASAAPATSARSSRKTQAEPTQQAPGVTSGNPFAGG